MEAIGCLVDMKQALFTKESLKNCLWLEKAKSYVRAEKFMKVTH